MALAVAVYHYDVRTVEIFGVFAFKIFKEHHLRLSVAVKYGHFQIVKVCFLLYCSGSIVYPESEIAFRQYTRIVGIRIEQL